MCQSSGHSRWLRSMKRDGRLSLYTGTSWQRRSEARDVGTIQAISKRILCKVEKDVAAYIWLRQTTV
jgi:hypothetical protein